MSSAASVRIRRIDLASRGRDPECPGATPAQWPVRARRTARRGISLREGWGSGSMSGGVPCWTPDRSDGVVSIARIQEQAGLSKKRLIQIFREQIGVTPKLYARIVRLRRALTLLHEGGRSPADVAAAVGYYDQPHMNLDFRELAGL